MRKDGLTKRSFTGLGEQSQPPLFEFSPTGDWLLWLSYNRDRTAGTYLRLNGDGSIDRYTEGADGTICDNGRVKPAV